MVEAYHPYMFYNDFMKVTESHKDRRATCSRAICYGVGSIEHVMVHRTYPLSTFLENRFPIWVGGGGAR